MQFFLPLLFLALGQVAVAGRESDNHALAVDTAAYFQRGQNYSDATIDKLGRTIAKELAHELRQDHHHTEIAHESRTREHAISEHTGQPESSGLLEKLATISHVLEAEERKVERSRFGGSSAHSVTEATQDVPHKKSQGGLDSVAVALLGLKQVVVRSRNPDDKADGGDDDVDKQVQQLPDWETLDPEHKGSLTLDDIKEVVGDDVSSLDAVFKKIDKDGSGKIDEKEYDAAKKDGTVTPEMFDDSASILRKPHVLMPIVSLLTVACTFA